MTQPQPIDLELQIVRHLNGTTVASMQVHAGQRRVDPASDVPISLDDTKLREHTNSSEKYGELLTEMVFVPRLRLAWEGARAYAAAAAGMRVRLELRGDDTLHALRWELLQDPVDSSPLAYQEHTRLSRFLPTTRYPHIPLIARSDVSAVVVVANPTGSHLPPIDVANEVARAQAGLKDIPVTLLDGRHGRPRATLNTIAETLRNGPNILYVVCHGNLVDGLPYLWLEQEEDEVSSYRPVAGNKLISTIAQQQQLPSLVVLASCQSGGSDEEALSAIGPQLAQQGVGAVMAMQSQVPQELVAQLIPRLFRELMRDGQIDRALAAARAGLPVDSPWWMPKLWMAVKNGALWRFQATLEKPINTMNEEQVNLVELRQLLITHFNISELKELCFDIGVDYEDLGGQGRADNVRELIGYLKRRGRLSELLDKCQKLRPNVAWPKVT